MGSGNMEIEVLRCGVDTLDIAFQGALPSKVLARLRDARETARADKSDCLIEINGVEGHVGETGARGGYAFRFDTGPEGEIWLIKDNIDLEQWNIRVECRALGLALEGYEGVKARLLDRLEAMGARVLTESISRIDFAVDFVAEDFELKPINFIAHWHCRQNVHRDFEPEDTDRAYEEEHRGGRCIGVRVGSMPGRQVTIYDKRAEQRVRAGSPWFKIWGFEKDECPVVWRVELRAGKKHLDKWGLKTFAEVETKIGDVFRDALSKVRLVEARDPVNVTRSKDHALWPVVEGQAASALEAMAAAADAVEVREHCKAEILEMYRKQMVGLGVSYAVLKGESPARAKDTMKEIFASDWGQFAEDGRDYFRKFKRSLDRLSPLLKGG